MELQKLVQYLLNDVSVSKAFIANKLGCDPKTITGIDSATDGYPVVKIPKVRAGAVAGGLYGSD